MEKALIEITDQVTNIIKKYNADNDENLNFVLSVGKDEIANTVIGTSDISHCLAMICGIIVSYCNSKDMDVVVVASSILSAIIQNESNRKDLN